jgi:hypothetical protein
MGESMTLRLFSVWIIQIKVLVFSQTTLDIGKELSLDIECRG